MHTEELFSETPGAVAAIKRIVPLGVRDSVVRRMMCSDRESRRNFRRAHGRVPDQPLPVRLRALGDEPLWMRPGTDDAWVVRETMTYADCLPPDDIGDPEVIVDLGANIGATMTLFARRFPRARIIGLEPDPENAELCRRNLRPWRDRCELVEAAAWHSDGHVSLAGTDRAALTVADEGRGVRAMALTTVLAEHAGGRADFVKMDVEGTERVLLTDGSGWADGVGAISVEVHAPYSTAQCSADLRALGFEVTTRSASRGPRVIGRRA
ncbi:MAG TPA: FkbM family methyltransferase [Solirubrobacteraceae bacterium]|nr:FkbM family methyltransferase [Solirubrobacteraceae bacterium]